MVRGLALVVVAGCGRLGFDAASDGAPGHDEDGDGFGDAADRCPHLADDQTDSDQDGVGDSCDREPALARQTITRFATMRPGDVPLTPLDRTSSLGDALAFDGNGQTELFHDVPIADADIWFGIDVAAVGALPRQLAIEITDQPTDAHYYGELYEDAGTAHVGVSRYTAPGYLTIDNMLLAGAVHTGAVTMHVATTQDPPQISVEIGWPGEPYVVIGVTPQLAPVMRFSLFVENLAIEVRYLAVITTS